MLFHHAGSSPIEFLIVGLGNPERKYDNTRHNTGFHALDAVADRYGAKVTRLKFQALIGEAAINGHRCLFMKPQTYMNNSGEAVKEAMQFYKIPIDHTIVLFDDISLEPSKLRIRRKGSDGGHNGIKSIIYQTGSDDFPRIKLGVGAKPHPDYDLAAWVLSAFTKEEQEKMRESIQKCPDIIERMVNGETEKAMNEYNS